MDDCHNSWGTTLCVPDIQRGKRKAAVMEAQPDESDLSTFRLLAAKDLGWQLPLIKITPCGSDANLYAVNAATMGNNEGCLMAAGSYVSGDGGPLQVWSTSSFSIDQGPAYIKTPDEVTNQFTKTHTFALPYYIPGVMSNADREKYEDECLMDLHIRCLVQQMKGKPVTAVFLELTLANNGATLSDRALTMLGQLARHHRFGFIVDEIMTGGREGTMTSSQTKPSEFTKYIKYLTMGKWMTRGLVFASEEERNKQTETLGGMSRRGQSTSIDCRSAMDLWTTASNLLSNTAKRRQTVLRRLGVTEDQVWGKGLHIFAPVSRQSNSTGSKLRFLPMLSNTPIDSFRLEKRNIKWTKQHVSDTTVKLSRSWLSLQYIETQEDKNYYNLASAFAQMPFDQFLSTQHILDEVMPSDKSMNTKTLSVILRVAEEAGLVSKMLKTVKRIRGWEIQEYSNPPWGL